MPADLFRAFLASDDTLRVYEDGRLVYSSKKDRLLPLMEYIAGREAGDRPITVLDKVMGNAAALLAIRAGCGEVYSPLGSDLAVRTLEAYDVRHHLERTVPYILRDDGAGLCPMEQMSIGKSPEDFYLALKAKIEANKSIPLP
jgi:hypothetical protein